MKSIPAGPISVRAIITAALLGTLLGHSTNASPPPAPPPPNSQAANQPCTTCESHGHRIAPPTAQEARENLRAFAAAEHPAASSVLDNLLYHGVTDPELASLPPHHRAFLKRELARTHATVAIPLVDTSGQVLALARHDRVALGRKTHLVGDDVDFSGTIMRVGLQHLWSRY